MTQYFHLLFSEDAGMNNVHNGKYVTIIPGFEMEPMYTVKTLDGHIVSEVFHDELKALSPEENVRINMAQAVTVHGPKTSLNLFEWAMISGSILFVLWIIFS